MSAPYRLSNYPHVWVRIACSQCGRAGRFRLARLAQRYGAETLMDDVLYEVSRDCRYQCPPGTRLPKYGTRCHAMIIDSPEPKTPPPDLPSGRRGGGFR